MGETVGAGSVTVELVNNAGRVIKSIQSAYDGFYVISNIPLGKYSVRVSPQQLEELGLKADPTTEFELTSDQQFESGLDLTLRKSQP